MGIRTLTFLILVVLKIAKNRFYTEGSSIVKKTE
jgi:hypothetical protein